MNFNESNCIFRQQVNKLMLTLQFVELSATPLIILHNKIQHVFHPFSSEINRGIKQKGNNCHPR